MYDRKLTLSTSTKNKIFGRNKSTPIEVLIIVVGEGGVKIKTKRCAWFNNLMILK